MQAVTHTQEHCILSPIPIVLYNTSDCDMNSVSVNCPVMQISKPSPKTLGGCPKTLRLKLKSFSALSFLSPLPEEKTYFSMCCSSASQPGLN